MFFIVKLLNLINGKSSTTGLPAGRWGTAGGFGYLNVQRLTLRYLRPVCDAGPFIKNGIKFLCSLITDVAGNLNNGIDLMSGYTSLAQTVELALSHVRVFGGNTRRQRDHGDNGGMQLWLVGHNHLLFIEEETE
jgi:hypothetical protein